MRQTLILPLALLALACQSPPNPATVPPNQFTAAWGPADRRIAPLLTALSAADVAIAVCANNLANAQTTAFKRSRINFEDLPYDIEKLPAYQANGDIAPAALQVGKGVQISNTQLDLEQGATENTGRQLDLAINGQGFFKVCLVEGIGDGFGYTRNGNFFVNKEGDLIIGSGNGYRLEPKITIPKGVTDISISAEGVVEVTRANQNAKLRVGQLQLVQFMNPQGLNLLGGTIFTQTESSGPPTSAKPGENGAGLILQGFLEASNVDPVKEQLKMRFLQNWRAAILKAIDETR